MDSCIQNVFKHWLKLHYIRDQVFFYVNTRIYSIILFENQVFTPDLLVGKLSKLKMEIGTLTTLLLGYKTAECLYALERIEGKQEAVDRLDDVLYHKIPYISDYI